MIPLVDQSKAAYDKGFADGLARTLTRADIMAKEIGWVETHPDAYPHHLARCYLQGHTDGSYKRIRDARKATS